jgi:predicted transcriptional regulator
MAIDRLLSARDLSEESSIPVQTIYKIMARREVPVVRYGRAKRVRESAWKLWVERREVPAE